MSRADLAFTHAQLHQMGMKVLEGRVVPIDTPEPAPPKPLPPEFPDVKGSWCLHGVWHRAPRPAFMDPVREKENQQDIRYYWMGSLGCTVLSLSQYRPSKVAIGLPDLFVFGPPHFPQTWFWETKKPVDAELSEEQIAFALHCQRTKQLYGCGPSSAAVAFAAAIGLSSR